MSSCSSTSYIDCLTLSEQLQDLKKGKGYFNSPRYNILEYWLFEMKHYDLYKQLSKHGDYSKTIKILEDNDIINWLHYYFLCIAPSVIKFEDCKSVCKHECMIWFFLNEEERSHIKIPSCIKDIQKNWVFRDKPNKYQGWYYHQLLLIKKLEHQLRKFIWIYKKNDTKQVKYINMILVDIDLLELIVQYVDNKITHQEMLDNINSDFIGKKEDYSDNIGNKNVLIKSSLRKCIIKNKSIPYNI